MSPKLVQQLADLYPESVHVLTMGLDHADDGTIWEFARQNDFAIVTKDADYNALSVLRGWPPKVVWLLIGNCFTNQIEALLRAHHVELEAFATDPSVGTIALN